MCLPSPGGFSGNLARSSALLKPWLVLSLGNDVALLYGAGWKI